jgi:hypothetical protein
MDPSQVHSSSRDLIEQGDVVACSLILCLLLCEMHDGSHRMYDTSPSRVAIAHDCLHLLIVDGKALLVVKMDVRVENIRFCRQSVTEDMPFVNGERWTFDDLRQMNVTAGQLFDWYTPVDLIEDYLLGNEVSIFFNCSERGSAWFGTRCQYTFDSTSEFHEILWDRFDAKDSLQVDVLSITHGTCYEIPADQWQSILCLDWREICDGLLTRFILGKMDCVHGFDE